MQAFLPLLAVGALCASATAQQSSSVDPTVVPGLTPTIVQPAPSARATTACDDFNRAALGSDWAPAGGSPGIFNNMFGSSSGNSMAQHTTASVPVGSAVMSIDLPPLTGSLSYGAVAHGLGGSTNLFTKLQGSSSYTQIGFYSGFNGAGYGTGFTSITPIAEGIATMYLTNSNDTMNVDIDTDRDGVIDVSYTNAGALAYAATAGTAVGIGAYGSSFGSADDFQLNGGCGPQGPALALSCGGGSATADLSNCTPGGPVAVVYGPAGSYTQAGAVCTGVTVDLIPATTPLILFADGAGAASLTRPVGPGACGSGLVVQGVDIATCTPTNSAAL